MISGPADLLAAGTLALCLAVISWTGAAVIGPAVLAYNDCWFEADSHRVFLNMSTRWSDQRRISVHPLFSLLVFPATKALRLLNLDATAAVRTIISGTAAVWIGSLFGLLRLVQCRRTDAVLFSLVGGLSSASLFWFSVPETYPFGSLSLIWALGLVALSQRRALPAMSWVVVSALTLSFTITNWMAGIIATAVSHPWRRTAQLTVNAFCLVVLLWAVEKQIFPNVPFFLTDQRDEPHFMLPQESGGMVAVARAFAYHSMIMPAIEVSSYRWQNTVLSVNSQASPLASGGWWGAIATGLWTGLLALGGWTVVTIDKLGSMRFALVAIMLGQFVLHALYGGETFLYSLHWLPLLVVVVALPTLTALRPFAVALAVGLLIAITINNLQQFHDAALVMRLDSGIDLGLRFTGAPD